MTLRVLLIESQAEELLFLQDVLREIEQERLLPEWPEIECYCAATWAEAQRILSTSLPHAILLGVKQLDGKQPEVKRLESGPDELAPDSTPFRSVQAAAPDVPVILLLEPAEEPQALRLMRDGAQDFLFKSQIDCGPLAHALRNAVVRHRILSAARAASLNDSLTGLPNRAGFLAIAARDRKLAERLGRRWMLLVAEPHNLLQITEAFGEQHRDLALAGIADQLRGLATPADLVARIGERHFAISVFESNVESAQAAWARIRAAAAEHRIDVGASIFDPGFDSSRTFTVDAMLEQSLADLPQTPRTTQPPPTTKPPRATKKVAGAA
jgi:diguanylate cyclase (GGDEF)-like protein